MRLINEILKSPEVLAIFHKSSIGIALVGADRKSITINPTLRLMLGYDGTGGLDALVSRLSFGTDGVKTDLAALRQLLRGRREAYRDCRCLKRNGRYVWGRVSVTLVRGNDRKPQFAILLVEDLSNAEHLRRQVASLTTQPLEYFDSLSHVAAFATA